jgi:hypothetical protein
MTVVTAPTGSYVCAFCNGMVYDLKNSLSVCAQPVSGVGSVIFTLDGAFLRTENYQPYTAGGNKHGGVYYAWKPTIGAHTLTAIPYSKNEGKGVVGTPLSVSFKAINSALTPTPTPTPTPSATPTPMPSATPTPTASPSPSAAPGAPALAGMTLVTAPTGFSVGAFSNGTIYDLKNSLSVRAEPVSGVTSVIFKLDGALLRTENYRPYSAGGNKHGGAYYAWKPTVGAHTLTAIPYSEDEGKGVAGTPLSVSFKAINSALTSSSKPIVQPTATPSPTPIILVTPPPRPTPTVSSVPVVMTSPSPATTPSATTTAVTQPSSTPEVTARPTPTRRPNRIRDRKRKLRALSSPSVAPSGSPVTSTNPDIREPQQ